MAGALHAQPKPQSLAPWVVSPANVVDKMLEIARVKPGETVFDLGSGDGRVLIAAASKFGAKAVGVELSERLVRSSQQRIKDEGLEDKITVVHANLMDVDVSGADVVVLYLLHDANETVRPKLEKQLRAGARVVSHDYEIRGWKYQTKESAQANRREHTIYVYEMPPKKQ